jgi:hypothetical protein
MGPPTGFQFTLPGSVLESRGGSVLTSAEATTLLKLLEEADGNPVTAEKHKSLKFQYERVKESRLVLQQFRELVSAGEGHSSEQPPTDKARASVVADGASGRPRD